MTPTETVKPKRQIDAIEVKREAQRRVFERTRHLSLREYASELRKREES